MLSTLAYWFKNTLPILSIRDVTIKSCLSPVNLVSLTYVRYFCVLTSARLNLWTSEKRVALGLLLNWELISSIDKTLFPTDSA